MSSPETSTTLTLSDEQATENRIRAVLGLGPDAASTRRPNHNQRRPGLALGGEISGAVVSSRRAPEAPEGLRQRLAAAEAALKAEKSELVAAQRALKEAQRAIQQLQTKLAHTEIAAAEALAVERQAFRSARAQPETLVVPALHKPGEKPLGLKKKGRPPLKSKPARASEPEPEPVQWWLPDYRAKKKR